MAVGEANGRLHISVDSGATFVQRGAASTSYVGVFIGPTSLIALVQNGALLSSLDDGATLTPSTSVGSALAWRAVSCSADGKVCTAVINPGGIYVTRNGDAAAPAWVLSDSTSRSYMTTRVSPDGKKAFAAV
jgi:hypothetical protein